MDEHESIQVVELRISYRYATAHPWVVQAIRGFLSAYFMEHPGFRVQRYMEELESGTHLWICEAPIRRYDDFNFFRSVISKIDSKLIVEAARETKQKQYKKKLAQLSLQTTLNCLFAH